MSFDPITLQGSCPACGARVEIPPNLSSCESCGMDFVQFMDQSVQLLAQMPELRFSSALKDTMRDLSCSPFLLSERVKNFYLLYHQGTSQRLQCAHYHLTMIHLLDRTSPLFMHWLAIDSFFLFVYSAMENLAQELNFMYMILRNPRLTYLDVMGLKGKQKVYLTLPEAVQQYPPGSPVYQFLSPLFEDGGWYATVVQFRRQVSHSRLFYSPEVVHRKPDIEYERIAGQQTPTEAGSEAERLYATFTQHPGFQAWSLSIFHRAFQTVEEAYRLMLEQMLRVCELEARQQDTELSAEMKVLSDLIGGNGHGGRKAADRQD